MMTEVMRTLLCVLLPVVPFTVMSTIDAKGSNSRFTVFSVAGL